MAQQKKTHRRQQNDRHSVTGEREAQRERTESRKPEQVPLAAHRTVSRAGKGDRRRGKGAKRKIDAGIEQTQTRVGRRIVATNGRRNRDRNRGPYERKWAKGRGHITVTRRDTAKAKKKPEHKKGRNSRRHARFAGAVGERGDYSVYGTLAMNLRGAAELLGICVVRLRVNEEVLQAPLQCFKGWPLLRILMPGRKRREEEGVRSELRYTGCMGAYPATHGNRHVRFFVLAPTSSQRFQFFSFLFFLSLGLSLSLSLDSAFPFFGLVKENKNQNTPPSSNRA